MFWCVEKLSDSFVIEDEVISTDDTVLDLAPELDSRVIAHELY